MKCLIVDDEFSARQSLVMMGRYKELGITCILEAENGRQALEIAGAERPEIVITDMKMGEMDGVGLLKGLTSLNYQPQIVVISGYSDYSYMHSALHAEALDYVLKPIGIERFNECLEQAIARYRTRNKHTEDLRNQELLKRLDIHNAAENELGSYPMVHEFIEKCHTYRIFLLSIHDFARICVERFNGIPDLLFYSVQTEVEEILSSEKPVLLLRLIGESSEVVGLIGCGESDSKKWCVEKLNHMLRELDRRLSLPSNIGLSDPESGLANVSSAFRQARKALLRGNMNDDLRIFTISDTAQAEPVRIGVNDQQLSVLFRTGQLDEIMLYINSLIAELVKRCAYNLRNLELVFLDLLNLLNTLLRSQNLPIIASCDSEAKRVLRDIWQHATRPELVENDIRNYLESYIDQISAQSSNTLLADMCFYIDQHYPERISLSTLSERFYISREYVSRIFKKGLHTTFVNYLTEVRLRHVCRLLLTCNHSVSQIADETGFKEAGYMIRVFKKTYGVTPKDYRAGK